MSSENPRGFSLNGALPTTGQLIEIDALLHARRAAEVHAARAVSSRRICPDDREDVVQDALLGVWRALPSFDPTRASVSTYIERVVQSKITSSIRDRRALKRRFSEPLTELQEARDAITAIHYEVDLQRALDRLSPYDRMVATLLVDQTPAEAARSLGIARSTLYVIIARIRKVFVDAGVYPACKTQQNNPSLHRTVSSSAAYIVSSRPKLGQSKPTRRNVYRKADTPVGGL